MKMTKVTVDRLALDQAVFALYEAKQAEEAAHAQRLDCERRIIELVGVKEGTTSQKTELYKISTVGTLKRDFAKGVKIPCEFRVQEEDLPPGFMPADILRQIVTIKAELSVSALKALATANPDAYRVACQWIESRPQKPAVKLEIVEQVEEAA